jgi:hypothetical protein
MPQIHSPSAGNPNRCSQNATTDKGQVVRADEVMLSMNEVKPVFIISLLTSDD